MRNEGGGFAEINDESHLFWHSLSHIRRFSSLRMTKCAVPLPPSPLNLQNPLPPLWQTIKGQHAPGANPEPLLPIEKAM